MQISRQQNLKSLTLGLAFLLGFLSLAACSTPPNAPPRDMHQSYQSGGAQWTYHSVEAQWSAPDTQMLECLYGTQSCNYGTGRSPRHDSIYVKWQIKSTGRVMEDRVDLRPLLPADISKHGIHVLVDGQQLRIYFFSLDPVRPYFTIEEGREIDAAKANQPYRALGATARNNVWQIYPTKFQIYPYQPKTKR